LKNQSVVSQNDCLRETPELFNCWGYVALLDSLVKIP